MRIEVLPKDIHHGHRNNALDCPVARAVRRCAGVNYAAVDMKMAAFGNLPRDADLDNDHQYENLKGTLKEVDIPDMIWNIIEGYDCGEVMYPFGFEL